MVQVREQVAMWQIIQPDEPAREIVQRLKDGAVFSPKQIFDIHGDHVLAVDFFSGVQLTYRDVDRMSSVVCSKINMLGAVAGDRIVLAFGNTLEFVISYFAVLRQGMIAVPVDPDWSPEKVDQILEQTETRIILHQAGISISKAGLNSEMIEYRNLILNEPADVLDVTLEANNPVAILYTSGTTGSSKGAVIKCGRFIENIVDYGLDLGVGAGTRFIVSMPMSHIDGWTYSTLQPFLFGAGAVITPPFNAQVAATFDRVVADGGGNVFVCVPAMLSGLLRMKPRYRKNIHGRLDFVICGSSRLDESLKDAFESAFGAPILENYGSTEALLVAYYTKDVPFRSGSVGRIPAKCTVRIGDDGEIMIRSPYIFDGYYKNPDRTAAAFRDGWYLIGDIGTVDEDGYLFLGGRKGDVINRGGIKINPRDIDDVIASHPCVVDSATIGIENERASQDVYSFVQLSGDAGDLDEYLMARLSPELRPLRVVRVPALPRNHLGKIVRAELLVLKIRFEHN
ncbi:class I adenylate-forming enzyme family protein [Burkholderia sp. Z1]|uniref:class I adenylate-forming enzyme family protein n=1 Tax=Burkholderia sp. Z1 TaxID=2759039 RepID=UPI001865B106|nr:class I adenylate-forming enzyme family protein [Burkholderia sp. Z1]